MGKSEGVEALPTMPTTSLSKDLSSWMDGIDFDVPFDDVIPF